jgi:hypothetical protein
MVTPKAGIRREARTRADAALAPKAAGRVDADRDEILRLIATLQERRAMSPASSSAQINRQEKRPRRRGLLGRLVHRKAAVASEGEGVVRRGEDPARLVQRERELETIRALRARLEARERGREAGHAGRDPVSGVSKAEARGGDSKPAGAVAKAARQDEPRYTFRGVIQGELLSDMLQLVSSNALGGVFTIQGDQARFVLYFDEGQLCHAEGGGASGEAAFFAAFANREGEYTFLESSEGPAERTISANTQFLILEALRQLDEGATGDSD